MLLWQISSSRMNKYGRLPCKRNRTIREFQRSDGKSPKAGIGNLYPERKNNTSAAIRPAGIRRYVTSHTRAKHFAVWRGARSLDWARGRFPLAEGQSGMEKAPLLIWSRCDQQRRHTRTVPATYLKIYN